jgi:hypothetical protein
MIQKERDQLTLCIVWNCVYVQIRRGTLTFNPALAAEIYDHLMVLVLHISAQMFSQLKLMVPSPGIFPDKVCLLAQMPEVPGFSLYIYIPCHTFLKSKQSTRGFVRCATFLYFLLQDEFYKKTGCFVKTIKGTVQRDGSGRN